MRVYRCDKCGAEFRKESDLQPISGSWGSTELCQGCIVRLREWLKPDPVVREGRC